MWRVPLPLCSQSHPLPVREEAAGVAAPPGVASDNLTKALSLLPPLPATPSPGAGLAYAGPPVVLNAISSDGMFHSMYVSNGDEPAPPMAFLPPNANAGALTVIDSLAYATTSRGCGGASNSMWALDLTL